MQPLKCAVSTVTTAVNVIYMITHKNDFRFSTVPLSVRLKSSKFYWLKYRYKLRFQIIVFRFINFKKCFYDMYLFIEPFMIYNSVVD